MPERTCAPPRLRSSEPSLAVILGRSATSRSGQSSPTKCSDVRLYDLPPSLESPGSVSIAHRARPGGLAGMRPESYDARSVDSGNLDRRSPSAVPDSDHPLRRGSALGANDSDRRSIPEQGSPSKEQEEPSEENLALFAYHCKEFYLASHAPPESAAYISTALARLPPGHRSIYMKLQATLRSLAHLHHLRVRLISFHALIHSTISSGSLSPPSQSILGSEDAILERKDRFGRFVETWCAAGSGGLEPFFRGLWAVLRAQSRGGARRGGAGCNRVVWEIDDAVFLESSGLDFMHEAVTMLKGVLGFAEESLTAPPRLKRVRTVPKPFLDARASRSIEPPRGSSAQTRDRAPSDPFMDSRGQPSPRKERTSSRAAAPLGLPTPYAADGRDEVQCSLLVDSAHSCDDEEQQGLLLGWSDPTAENMDEDASEDDIVAEEEELNKRRFRLWIFPAHITDQEAESLMTLLPAAIRNRDVRLPSVCPGDRARDIFREPASKAGRKVPPAGNDQDSVLVHGTGRIWSGSDLRDASWSGTGWFRFKRWWKRLFGMG